MTTTQKLLGGSLLLLGGIGLTLLFQATFPTQPNPVCAANTECTPVMIRLKHGGPDCDVDSEQVNLRTAAAAAPEQPDQIYWCVQSGSTHYSIQFVVNPGPLMAGNNLLVDQNYGAKTCSVLSPPLAGLKPPFNNPFNYQILYKTSTGKNGVCTDDPMVILK
jgi:hypothetical protein